VQVHKQKDLGAALRDEWPLAAFTYLVPILAALLAASVFTGQMPSLRIFLGVSAAAALLSSAHLGKKTRAWRAVLNPTSSWLSREVLLFAATIGIGAGYLALAPDDGALGALTLAIGFATLISIDQVYATLPQIDKPTYHSAGAVLTGLFLVGVFSANPLVAGFVGTGKLLLYLRRKVGFHNMDKPVRPGLSALRTASGFLVPLVVWPTMGDHAATYVTAAVLLGELVDRLEFYAELDLLTPERQMTIDLQAAISANPSGPSPRPTGSESLTT
jgi:DMSO reductase anchor subunit